MDIEKMIRMMSLEEKIGQLFQIGFSGLKPTLEIKEMIEEYKVGGIIYFSRNIRSPEQVVVLSRDLQKIASAQDLPPLLISTDQEGGIVSRLTGGTHFPGNMTLGAAGEPNLAYATGAAAARELNFVGINMNLAPALDVNSNPDNPVIGVRSFGEDPELVGKLGAAMVRGIQSAGVAACGKHFPGHGNTAIDSHLDLPVINSSLKYLKKVDLYPFKKVIEENIDCIMISHINFKALVDEKMPATLSKNVVTGLLRKRMGFKGIIITDCMEMQAVDDKYNTNDSVLLALKAGVDIILISHTYRKQKLAVEAVRSAVRKGVIREERIDCSVRRILKLKQKRINRKDIDNRIGFFHFQQTKSRSVAEKVARKGVTLVRNKNKLLPLKVNRKKRVYLLDFEIKMNNLAEDEIKFVNSLPEKLREEGLNVDYQTIINEQLKYRPEVYDLVIVCCYNAAENPEQVELIHKLNKKDVNLVVISIRNPYDLKEFPEVPVYLCSYDYAPVSLSVVGDIIVGKQGAQGQLPVTIL